MRGYAYDRRDVTGRGLANAYAQTLGTIFSSGGEKPYEVELFVAEIGDAAADDQIYRLTYDGQVADEHGYAVMGGAAEVVAALPRGALHRGRPLAERSALAVAALGHTEAEDRVIPASDLEVAVLDRTRTQPRKFVRIRPARLDELLGERGPAVAHVAHPRTAARLRRRPGADDPDDPTDPRAGLPRGPLIGGLRPPAAAVTSSGGRGLVTKPPDREPRPCAVGDQMRGRCSPTSRCDVSSTGAGSQAVPARRSGVDDPAMDDEPRRSAGEIRLAGSAPGQPRPVPAARSPLRPDEECLRDLRGLSPGAARRTRSSPTSRPRGCSSWQLPKLPEQVPVFAAVTVDATVHAGPDCSARRLVQRASPLSRHGLPVEPRGDPAPRCPRPRPPRPRRSCSTSALAPGPRRPAASGWKLLPELAGPVSGMLREAVAGRRRASPSSGGETRPAAVPLRAWRSPSAAGRAVRRATANWSPGPTSSSPAPPAVHEYDAAAVHQTRSTCAVTGACGASYVRNGVRPRRPAEPPRSSCTRSTTRAGAPTSWTALRRWRTRWTTRCTRSHGRVPLLESGWRRLGGIHDWSVVRTSRAAISAVGDQTAGAPSARGRRRMPTRRLG